MSKTAVWQREIPVRHEVDVFVAGGGPAGVAAAVAAARQGARVFLAEGHTCLGGMGTAGLVPAFMQFGDGVNFLAAGIGQEVYKSLYDMGGLGPGNKYEEYPHCVSIRAEVLKRLYEDMMLGAKAEFAYQTQLIGVETSGEEITMAICAAKSGIFAVQAKVYIDATGDGDLAAWAGAEFEKGDEQGNMMPGTLCSLWSDVDWKRVREEGAGPDDRNLVDSFKDNVFTVEDRHLPGMFPVASHVGGGNIGHAFGVDGTDERSLTEAFIEQRKRLLEYERYYKQYLKGYENIELVGTASLFGLRETRRIIGDYVLNAEDFLERAVFDDEIGRYAYPVDIHPAKPSDDTYKDFLKEYREKYHYKKGESYGVPYRTLTPKGLSNVLVTGRCVSSDRYIQGSIRVMPGCYITGQAAGVAASLALNHGNNTRGFAITELQSALKRIGAFLPNS